MTTHQTLTNLIAESAESPFSYGTDLDYIWRWGGALRLYLEKFDAASPFAWIRFRPDRNATDAMDRLSARHPQVIRQILDHLDHTESCFGKHSDSQQAEDDFLVAMEDLSHRILNGAKAIGADRREAKATIGEGMPWQEARDRAEKHVKRNGNAFPGVRALARIVGCSKANMSKAIEGSRYLNARYAEYKATRGKGSEVPLTDVHTEGLAQTTEPPPTATLDELIASQDADAREDDRRGRAAGN